MGDTNFDDLAPRFRRNIYSSHKGAVRLAVLQQDFKDYAPAVIPISDSGIRKSIPALHILDAGGGQGQFAIELAKHGHNLTLCDLSRQMIDLAQGAAKAEGLSGRFQFVHSAVQDFCQRQKSEFDLILCHALLEWVENPEEVLRLLTDSLKPGACLSLIYYNRNALVYKNLLRANFKKIRQQQWQRHRGSLTPKNPLTPSDIDDWIRPLPLKRLCESGIRVFSDYIFDRELRESKKEEIVEMELRFCRQQPYLYLGRYIHLLLQKLPTED